MSTAPGLTQWLPLPYGPLGQFLRDPLCFLVRARERFGDVFRFRTGPLLVHYLFHPDHVRRVLHDHYKNYPRGWHYRLMRRLLGDSLLVSEGDHWLRQRRLTQPAFLRQRLAGYAAVMADATAGMLARWDEAAEAGRVIDVGAEMSRLTLAIAGRTLFDRDVSGQADAVGRALGVLLGYLEQRFNHPFTSPPLWVPTAGNRRFLEAVRTLNRIVLRLIRQRRREGRDHGDLLSMLIQARDEETGEAMTDDQLRSEVLTFFAAGHETTATALTWTWYLLAGHASVRQRVREEVDAVCGGRPPAVEDVPRLTVTRMVIEESMRLYPPIWAIPRQAVGDDEVGGFRIPAGSTVVVCPYVTHRHPDVWEAPEAFDPDRFDPDRGARRPKYAYFPFLGGPHLCIGNEFALLEMRLIVGMVLQRFDLELLPGPAVRPRATLAIRPTDPLRMRLQRVDRLAVRRGPPSAAASTRGEQARSEARAV
jgi:cytochrome P450